MSNQKAFQPTLFQKGEDLPLFQSYPYTQADEGAFIKCAGCGKRFHVDDNTINELALASGNALLILTYCEDCQVDISCEVAACNEHGQGYPEYMGSILIVLLLVGAVIVIAQVVFGFDLLGWVVGQVDAMYACLPVVVA